MFTTIPRPPPLRGRKDRPKQRPDPGDRRTRPGAVSRSRTPPNMVTTKKAKAQGRMTSPRKFLNWGGNHVPTNWVPAICNVHNKSNS